MPGFFFFLLAFVSRKRLCIKLDYHLGLALQEREAASEPPAPSFGVCGRTEQLKSSSFFLFVFFAAFLDPVHLNSEVAVA